MNEVITRRYKRLKQEALPLPNLLIVDGGIPQVKAALLALEKIDVKLNVIGLAKDDKHKTRAIITSELKEITLNKHSMLFLLLEAIQEEVHRFAITFFRNTHSKNTFASSLDNIEGIGVNRKKVLLENFDSIEDIKNAKEEKLKSLGLPSEVIKNIKEKL